MAEYKLFEGNTPHVSTFEFHEHRERAPHLEQAGHRNRLLKAAEFVDLAATLDGEPVSVSDLGCGDGGLLSVLQQNEWVSRCWGYDFAPANQAGWAERGVTAYPVDVFNHSWDDEFPLVSFGRVTVTTEVLEHLADPHSVVRSLIRHSNYVVASSPFRETDQIHDECHAWAWDVEGYAALFTNNGWDILEHTTVDENFQVLLAGRTGRYEA
jgi:SAM-dependent methyltransferase